MTITPTINNFNLNGSRQETVDQPDAAVAGPGLFRFRAVGLRCDSDQQDVTWPHRSGFLLRSNRVFGSPGNGINHRQVHSADITQTVATNHWALRTIFDWLFGLVSLSLIFRFNDKGLRKSQPMATCCNSCEYTKPNWCGKTPISIGWLDSTYKSVSLNQLHLIVLIVLIVSKGSSNEVDARSEDLLDILLRLGNKETVVGIILSQLTIHFNWFNWFYCAVRAEFFAVVANDNWQWKTKWGRGGGGSRRGSRHFTIEKTLGHAQNGFGR